MKDLLIRRTWLGWFITFAITALAADTAQAVLTLEAEINPDPAQPGELIDTQISVSSTSTTGNLTLRMLWPADLANDPVSVGGADDCGGICDPGEFITWNLGPLGPGASLTVGFTETVRTTATDGTLIPFAIQVLDGGSLAASITPQIEVQANSPLELAIDPLSDPVASSAILVYELVYGIAGSASAENAELSFPVPPGTQFLSATGGGMLAGSTVSWDFGTLAPNSVGRERVRLQVDALAGGSLLKVDAASLSAEVDFLPRESRAMAISRVDTELLQLDVEVGPNPADSSELLDVQVTVSNLGSSVTGNLSLRMLWPEHIANDPISVGGANDCGGICDAGEYINWSLGPLGPGVSLTVGWTETVRSDTADGIVIPLEFELLEVGRPGRNRSHTVEVQSNPLEVMIDPRSDPVVSGGTLVYDLIYGNAGSNSAENAQLRLPLPAGTDFLSASGGGVHAGGTVTWNLGALAPNSSGREQVRVQVDTLASGSLLNVDAAFLAAEVSFLDRRSQAMALSRVATSDLALVLEAGPNPAAPSELVDVQVLISNLSASPTGDLSLRALWPEHLANDPISVGGGNDCGGICDAGEYLHWPLGVLGPGVSQTVGWTETVRSGSISGTLIPLEFELLEAGLPARARSQTLEVGADSPLELTIDPSADPVPPNGTLVYELSFGNAGNATAEQTVLSFPIPDGTQFLAASDGGQLTAGEVVWNLGNLPPNSAGRVQVSVQVEALEGGTLLEVDAATLSAEVNFLDRHSQAIATSRVAFESLQLSFETTPNPIRPSELLIAGITINNPSGSATGNLNLRMVWPEHLDNDPMTTGGSTDCGGICDAGEYLAWSLGPLGPGASVSVTFTETVRSSVADGILIPLEVELLEGGLAVRSESQTLLVHPFDDFDLDGVPDVLDEDDDNDGMPDWWEILHGLDPFDPSDANEDPDMDGLTNLEEFLAGTDPNVPNFIFMDGFESGDTSRWSQSVP